MPAIVPAGGTIDGRFQELAGTTLRCLAPMGGDTVLQIVVSALKRTEFAAPIVAAVPDGTPVDVTGVDSWTASADLGTQSIRNCLALVEDAERILICTSDLPFITAQAITEFVNRASPESDICIGLVTSRDYNAAFPGSPASIFLPLRECGPVTIGCLFLLKLDAVKRIDPWLDKLFSARKSLFQSASLLGPKVVFQLISKQLSIRSLRERARQLAGIDIDVLIGVSPVLAFDIDTPEDYEYAKAHV
jgi:CTP:molybdopterin cytidylyltransferase MocA